jgi:hypothetical protein
MTLTSHSNFHFRPHSTSVKTGFMSNIDIVTCSLPFGTILLPRTPGKELLPQNSQLGRQELGPPTGQI